MLNELISQRENFTGMQQLSSLHSPYPKQPEKFSLVG